MTARKKDPLKRKPQAEGEAKLLADVKDPGWHVIGVTEDDEGPGFAYSIGLHHNYGHPEIITFGLDVPILWRIVNVIAEKVKQGEKFEDCHEAEGVLEGYLVFFRSVEQRHYREYLGGARGFYEGDAFPALQCVWPDKAHRYPWHPDASEPFRKRQPVLYDAAGWRFQEGSNRAVFTTKRVIHDGLPVLLVSHDAEGDWQFLCGTTNQVNDAALVSLGGILQRDQTLLDLADLPAGWQARRERVGSAWKRQAVRGRS
jgi:hypothetical protein